MFDGRFSRFLTSTPIREVLSAKTIGHARDSSGYRMDVEGFGGHGNNSSSNSSRLS